MSLPIQLRATRRIRPGRFFGAAPIRLRLPRKRQARILQPATEVGVPSHHSFRGQPRAMDPKVPAGERADASESPLVLLVNDEEWTARSLDAVLRPRGYSVLLAYTAQQGIELSRKTRPDCILVDYGLPDMTGADLSARLREIPTVRASTPLFVISTRSIPRPERLHCLRNGAWDVLQLPFDTEEFLLRMERFGDAKRDADRALEGGHVDPWTGLYNSLGLTTRLREILAEAVRHDRPLACVAVGFDGRSAESPADLEDRPAHGFVRENDGPTPDRDEQRSRDQGIAQTLASVTRISDIIARIGKNDFVVVAPSTDEQGARRLADRLLDAFRRERSTSDVAVQEDLHPRAGYHASRHPAPEGLRPDDFLTRATHALRRAQADDDGSWIRGFDPSELD